MFSLYNILLVLASPVILAVLLAKKRCRPGLRQRLGWVPGDLAEACRDGRTIWVHAVSMGEANAVVPLVRELRTRYPESRLLVSTVTETGKETILRQLAGQARHVYFPLDFLWSVRAALRAVRPRLIVIVETELWPNFLREAAARGIPVLLVNGRLSSDSFAGYLLIRSFYRRVLSAFTLCAVQTDRDAERMIRLGVDPARVVRTGNLKYDQVAALAKTAAGQVSRRDLGVTEGEELFVAGSTHPGEEEAVVDCYRRLLDAAPSLVLVLAPRHIERAEAVCGMVRARGFEAVRRTALAGMAGALPTGPRVIILDTRGELAALYREATLVFVGGSLVPIGGHNPLEPAAWGKGVVFGPHMDHFSEVADLLVRHGGGLQIHDARELAEAMGALLADRARLEQMGKAAYGLVLDNQGAVARTVALIAQVLGEEPPGSVNVKRVRGMRQAAFGSSLANNVERLTSIDGILSPLIPLSYLYGETMRLRAALYARGAFSQRSLPCRVISVGNLTVGGTGKTPVVIALANTLSARGHRVGVISRGYRRRSTSEILEVSDGRSVRGDPEETGDEPYLIARRCPGVAVAVGADRPRVGQYLVDRYHVEMLVLDDGFQHLALRRDTDLLLLDASAPFGNGYLLPCGRLREPVSAIGRASAVLLTRAGQAGRLEEIKARIRAAAPNVPIWVSDFVPSAVMKVGGEEEEHPRALKGGRVLAVSGIAQPDSFRRLLEEMGATVAGQCVFPDHHPYSLEDVQRVKLSAERLGVDRIVTTEKDAVKLAHIEELAKHQIEIWAVRIDLAWLEGREEWERVVLNG